MPDIRFDRGDTGVVNRSRNDIELGVEFDIVALNVTGTAVFGLLGRPGGSAAVIGGTGNTRQITGDVAGGYRVRITDDAGEVTHTFTVKTPMGQDFPAPGERANPDANDVDTDTGGTWVDDSETNLGGSFEGWNPKAIANQLLIELHLGANSGTGIVEGGVVTVNDIDPAQFDVAEGIAQHVDPTNPLASATRVDFGPFTAVDPDDIGTTTFTVLAISPAGALVQTKVFPGPEKRRTDALIQDVTHADFATITGISTSNHQAVNVSQALLDYVKAMGAVNIGNQYTAATAANLTIAKSAGSTNLPFLNGAFSTTDPNEQDNPGATTVTFLRSFRDSTAPGGFNVTVQTDVPAGLYDAGNDVLEAVGMNNWAIYWMDFFNNTSVLTAGQAVYNTMADACAAIFTENPVTIPAVANVPNTRRTAIIVKTGTTDLTDSGDATFVELQASFGSGASSVLSVFGRTGIVSALAGDYSADLITFTPDGDIAATEVQAAIVELRDDTDTKLAALVPVELLELVPTFVHPTNQVDVQTDMSDTQLEGCLMELQNDVEFNRLTLSIGASWNTGAASGNLRVCIYQAADGTVESVLSRVFNETVAPGDVSVSTPYGIPVTGGGTVTMKRGRYLIAVGLDDTGGSALTPFLRCMTGASLDGYNSNFLGVPTTFEDMGVGTAAAPPAVIDPRILPGGGARNNLVIHKFRNLSGLDLIHEASAGTMLLQYDAELGHFLTGTGGVALILNRGTFGANGDLAQSVESQRPTQVGTGSGAHYDFDASNDEFLDVVNAAVGWAAAGDDGVVMFTVAVHDSVAAMYLANTSVNGASGSSGINQFTTASRLRTTVNAVTAGLAEHSHFSDAADELRIFETRIMSDRIVAAIDGSETETITTTGGIIGPQDSFRLGGAFGQTAEADTPIYFCCFMVGASDAVIDAVRVQLQAYYGTPALP